MIGHQNPLQSQEVELNITPIIDCFTVLITFLLASACFLNVGYFEAETAGASLTAPASEPVSELIVKAWGQHVVELNWKGKGAQKLRLNLEKPKDRERLLQTLERYQSTPSRSSQILVSAQSSAPYEALTELMNELQTAKLPLVVGDFE